MSWQDKISEYCAEYNIPLDYLAETLSEPKVVPMVRGKAFEFSVMLALRKILREEVWLVDKPTVNAQLGFHDTDVRVQHKPTRKSLRIECKLADKESYRLFPNGQSKIQVKCMRSRTLGVEMVKELAPKLKVSNTQLTVHNDQYRVGDFDIVITSLGNTFYRTSVDGKFIWSPTANEIVFLKQITNSHVEDDLKQLAFERMYVAKAENLVVNPLNAVECTRRKCQRKKSCGFIPNYPVIEFSPATAQPISRWLPVEKIEDLLLSFVSK